MTGKPTPRVLAMVIRAVVGYVAYVFAIPAIVLQAATFLLGATSAYVLVLSHDVRWAEQVVARLADTFGAQHISYSGNPVPAILRWYATAALVLSVASAAWPRLFPSVRLRRRDVFFWLIGLDAACYFPFGIIGQETGHGPWPALILFSVTAVCTAIAFAAARASRAITRTLGA